MLFSFVFIFCRFIEPPLFFFFFQHFIKLMGIISSNIILVLFTNIILVHWLDFWRMSHFSLMLLLCYYSSLLKFIFLLFTSIYIAFIDLSSSSLILLGSAMSNLLFNLFLGFLIEVITLLRCRNLIFFSRCYPLVIFLYFPLFPHTHTHMP